jgi:nitrite reductase/ring-hydroxylating ferredoxin subunit
MPRWYTPGAAVLKFRVLTVEIINRNKAIIGAGSYDCLPCLFIQNECKTKRLKRISTMARWIEVMKEDEFSGEVEVIEYDGIDIAIFKLDDGYYAIDDECSHDEASLSEGEIVEVCQIECPMHGARFDIKTGKNLSFPAVVPVKSYAIKVENGVIYIEVED